MASVYGDPSYNVLLNNTGSGGTFKVNDGTVDTLVVDSTGKVIVNGDLLVDGTIKDKTGASTLTLEGPAIKLVTNTAGWDFTYASGVQEVKVGNDLRLSGYVVEALAGESSQDPVDLFRLRHDVSSKSIRLTFR